jgi:hypothetical protein
VTDLTYESDSDDGEVSWHLGSITSS